MNTQFIKSFKNKQTILLIALSIVLTLLLFLVIGVPEKNINAYLDDIAIVGIVSLGQLIVMINGGIDFSIQGIYCASAIMLSHIYRESILSQFNLPTIAIVFIILIMATCLGALNGICIAKFKVNPLIMTVATNALLEGILYAYTSGISGRSAPQDFKAILNETIAGIPILLIFWIIITVLLSLFISKTTAGRQMVATGTNKTASQLSGINTSRITILTYAMSAFFASAAGMLACANNGTSTLTMADNAVIQSLMVSLVAGASVFGGKGSILCTLLGALAYTSLNYIFKYIPVHTGIQDIIIGLLLMIMIVFSGINKSLFKKKLNHQL